MVHVKPGTEARLRRKLQAIRQGGLGNLQVIVDFDNTLTKPSSLSSWSIVEQSGYFSQSFNDKTLELFRHYHPIEADPLLSEADKVLFLFFFFSLERRKQH